VKFEILLVLTAYLLGSLPTALLVVRQVTGDDVRRKGSGNVGATNALRAAGWKAGVAVTLIDVAKGALSVWLMQRYNAALGVWVVVLVVSRWVALASMVASAVFPLALKLVDRPDTVTLVSVSAAAVLIIFRHSSNIRKMLSGEEVKVGDDSWR
jgi:glycerol-3-phosphate acyltransferase PlsY